MFCRGYTLKGDKCKRRVSQGNYCYLHKYTKTQAKYANMPQKSTIRDNFVDLSPETVGELNTIEDKRRYILRTLLSKDCFSDNRWKRDNIAEQLTSVSDVESVTGYGNKPLFIETCSNSYNNCRPQDMEKNMFLFEAFLKAGVDVNMTYKDETPLKMAFMYHDGARPTRRRIDALISAGANINHRDENGRTTLIFICREITENEGKYDRNCMRVVMDVNISILLENGANKDDKDNFGKTALDYLEEYKWHNKTIEKAVEILKGNVETNSKHEDVSCSICKKMSAPLDLSEFLSRKDVCFSCSTNYVLAPFYSIGYFKD